MIAMHIICMRTILHLSPYSPQHGLSITPHVDLLGKGPERVHRPQLRFFLGSDAVTILARSEKAAGFS